MLTDNTVSREKYILAAVAAGDEEAAWDSLDELEDLLETAGGEAICHVVQNLPHPDRASYVGRGKAAELRELAQIHEADGIICDDELSASQMRNLSELTDTKIIDRTTLILDIFAAHAKTREGRLQVEIAQQKYRYARLRGMGEALSRLGGGIGTRGPGETKLETDRRVIQKRISKLSAEIEEMKRARDTARKKRSSGPLPIAAIVGYTNAGKSTLLNRLTGADVLSEDKLFATLDPTTRTAAMPDGQQVLFTDTVGFINKLPHNLIDAFRSTLEEAGYADMIIHVIDASDPQAEMHRRVVYDTLRDLDIGGRPVITVWNKSDLTDEGETFRDFAADASVRISARTGEGLDDLYEAVTSVLKANRIYIEKVIPYSDAAYLARIRTAGQLISEEYEEDGIHIRAYIPASMDVQ